jgi:hypothetical protein
MWGRHVLKSHPNGEFICDYLENDAYLIGHLIVPQKYDLVYQEKHRAAKYEYYLRRGLPIPQEYMPRDELELLEKRRLYNEMTKRSGEGTSTKAFEPQIAMSMDGDHSRMKDVKSEEDLGRQIKCISIMRH